MSGDIEAVVVGIALVLLVGSLLAVVSGIVQSLYHLWQGQAGWRVFVWPVIGASCWVVLLTIAIDRRQPLALLVGVIVSISGMVARYGATVAAEQRLFAQRDAAAALVVAVEPPRELRPGDRARVRSMQGYLAQQIRAGTSSLEVERRDPRVVARHG